MELDQMNENLINIFTESQKTSAVHQKNAIILKDFYEQEHPKFVDSFKKIINCIITVEKSSPYLEKSMDFFGIFCSLLKQKHGDDNECLDHPLLGELFSHLLQASCLISDTIRLRSCQLINKIFDNLVGVDLSVELFDYIESNLLIRLQDPKSAIRQQAVATLHWLQDPGNQEDAIIPEFLNLMNGDSFAKVRQLCIEKIAARKDVVMSIIKRVCDVDVNVRLAAYKRLSNLPGFLKISEKRFILQNGFLETSDKIKEFFTKTLLTSWLHHYENPLKLMKSLRLDADEKDIEVTSKLFENILGVFFQQKSVLELSALVGVDENKLIPIENLNWEIISYWRIYVQYLSKNEEFEDELMSILPELVYFAKYVKKYYTTMSKDVTTVEIFEQQFILKQFFLMIETYDFSDPINRKCLNELVCNILETVTLSTEVTELVVRTLECSITNIDKRTQFVCEIISEILYPMDSMENEIKQKEKDFQMSQYLVKLQRLKAEQEDCIAQRNFIEAERLKNEIIEVEFALNKLKEEPLAPQKMCEKKTDLLTTVKCLDIAAGILLSPQVTSLTASLKTLKEDFINELLISENDTIRVKSFRCYALCCIIDKETSSNGIHIFSTPIFAYQNGEECDTQTLIICISAVVDLLRIYGTQLVAAAENEELSESMDEKHQVIFTGGTALTDVLQGLVDLMDDEQHSVQERAAFGLCQLVLSRRIISPSLISRLILKWCNPATGDEPKQTIAYTLQKIPLISQYGEILEEAILMTIKALFSAPRISPLADVNIENIAKFMLALCKTSLEAEHIHSNLATTICGEMINRPESRINSIYSKILLQIEIPDNKIFIRNLLKLCDQIRNNITERTVVNNILKFTSVLSKKNMLNKTIIEDNEENEELDDMFNQFQES